MGMLNYEEHIKEHELIALRYPEKAPVLASNGVTAQTNPLTGGVEIVDPITNTLRYGLTRRIGQRVSRAPKVLPFGFDVPANWTISAGALGSEPQPTYRKNSMGALKVTPSGSSCVLYRTNSISAYPQDLSSGGVVGMWVYCDSGTAQNGPSNAYITMILSNNYSRSNSLSFGFAGNHIRWNQWNYLVAHTAETGATNAQGTGATGWVVNGTGTFNGITQVELNFGNMSGLNIYVDSIEFGIRNKPTIVLGLDGFSSDLNTNILPMLNARGIPVTMAYNIDVSSVATNNALVPPWIAAGHDVVSHGAHHLALGTASANSTVDGETVVNALAMDQLGFLNEKTRKLYVYPQNATCPFVKTRLAEQGFVAARGYKNFHIVDTQYGIDGPLEIGAFDLGNPTSRARLLALLDAPSLYGCTCFYFFHDVNMTTGQTGPTGNNNTIYIDDLTSVLDKIKTLKDAGVDVLTFSEWAWRSGL